MIMGLGLRALLREQRDFVEVETAGQPDMKSVSEHQRLQLLRSKRLLVSMIMALGLSSLLQVSAHKGMNVEA